jgi:hypothetical protein
MNSNAAQSAALFISRKAAKAQRTDFKMFLLCVLAPLREPHPLTKFFPHRLDPLRLRELRRRPAI